MDYTIIWRHRCIADLTAIYTRARTLGHDTEAITAAVSEIDSLLQHQPETRGESRGGPERILVELPLSVLFEVYEDERTVLIYQVRYWMRS